MYRTRILALLKGQWETNRTVNSESYFNILSCSKYPVWPMTLIFKNKPIIQLTDIEVIELNFEGGKGEFAHNLD